LIDLNTVTFAKTSDPMQALSLAEENYLKTIYHLSDAGEKQVTTNAIAQKLNTKPASVSDMVRRLSEKKVVYYQKYQGVNISDRGKHVALKVIRKHRLWEVFLLEKLKFNWDEVHEVAEQLEHIQSPLLIKRLDEFLGFPKYDPHGDPIPDENGDFSEKPQVALEEVKEKSVSKIITVKDTDAAFLKYLDKLGVYIGARIKVLEKIEYDGSMHIEIDGDNQVYISKEVANNLLVTED